MSIVIARSSWPASVSLAALPAISMTSALTVRPPSSNAERSRPFAVQALPLTATLAVTLAPVLSLTVTLTVCPSSTPLVTPEILTLPCSAALTR
ncbi:hypothetical protein D3C84_1069450 [compost metagenome]